MESSVKKRLKFCSNGYGLLIKMAALPIYGKSLKTLQNRESFGAESWYIASRTQGLPSLFKSCGRFTFDFFYGKVKFAPRITFVWGIC